MSTTDSTQSQAAATTSTPDVSAQYLQTLKAYGWTDEQIAAYQQNPAYYQQYYQQQYTTQYQQYAQQYQQYQQQYSQQYQQLQQQYQQSQGDGNTETVSIATTSPATNESNQSNDDGQDTQDTQDGNDTKPDDSNIAMKNVEMEEPKESSPNTSSEGMNNGDEAQNVNFFVKSLPSALTLKCIDPCTENSDCSMQTEPGYPTIS